jgi:hypothetical protein
MGAVVVHILILLVVMAAGLLAGWLHRRARPEPANGEFGASLAFIAASFGLLLGLLVVFATTHYSDARTATQTEATAFVSLFDDLGPLSPAVGEPLQHDVVCYARSIVADDWRQMEVGSDVEAVQTRDAGDRMRLGIGELPASPAASAASAKLTEAGAARQQLLFLARPAIPTLLWVLIYLGAAVLVFLTAADLVARKETVIAGLACVVLMLTVVVGVLASLDRPFSPLARVEPTALKSALSLVEAGREGAPYLRPCP